MQPSAKGADVTDINQSIEFERNVYLRRRLSIWDANLSALHKIGGVLINLVKG